MRVPSTLKEPAGISDQYDTAAEKKEIEKYLFLYLYDRSKIVVTFALQALTDFAVDDKKMQPRIVRVLKEFLQTGSPAIKSRSQKLLKVLQEGLSKPPESN